MLIDDRKYFYFRSYEKMDVCSEPPILPAPEEYLENGQDQKLYLEVSKGQQDGIELHISETDDAGQILFTVACSQGTRSSRKRP